MMTPDYSTLDSALEIALESGPELSNGFTSHAPMATEAMCAMGRADAVMPWIENYRRHFTPRPRPSVSIDADRWRDALGIPGRFADWSVFFQKQLKERAWEEVVRQWAALLAAGLAGAATHGVIRAGHAVRGLANQETPLRRRELGDGLAYWAATYEELPEGRARAQAGLPSRAIASVPLLPAQLHGHFHTIVEALVKLDDFPAFAGTISLVDASGHVSAFISDLTETFARAYLANARDIISTVAFVHTVTAPAALRTIAGFLDTGGITTALPFAWQASAAIYAVYGVNPPQAQSAPAPDETAEDLIQRAIENGDEHVIKFTEACLREHALNPRPSYLAAARHVVTALKF
jgi:hypothetical protein